VLARALAIQMGPALAGDPAVAAATDALLSHTRELLAAR
jgi:hypothetical protein